MAFGDKEDQDQASGTGALNLSLIAGAAADDLNACSYFTGATSIPATPTGYTESSKCTNTGNADEGVIWFQLIVDSGDDSISIASAGDQAMAVLSRYTGAFASSPLDIDNDEVGNETSANPWVSVVSAATSQAVEVMVSVVCQRNNTNHTTDNTVRTGTATPTGNMTKVSTIQQGSDKRIYQDFLVLTGIGTLGFDRDNPAAEEIMGTYASFKEAAAGGGGPHLTHGRLLRGGILLSSRLLN